MPSTLLEISNEVLRAVGERPLLQLSGVTADRVKDCIRQALRDVESAHTWDWLYATVPAVSWSAHVATLIDVQRVFAVMVGDTTQGLRELDWKDSVDFRKLAITSYTGTADTARNYTMPFYGAIAVNPYPADFIAQSRIQFTVMKTLTMPNLGTDVFQIIPDRFLPLVARKASAIFVARHLDDAGSVQGFDREYQVMVQQYRTNERKAPQRQLSTYRRRTR